MPSENDTRAPSSSEEGVGGGGVSPETLRQRATTMRNNPTEPEKRLWQALRKRQIVGFKFRRKHVIGRRIVDFYCSRAKLAVEVDGETHDWSEDLRRDHDLNFSHGVMTLRFTNDDVMSNIEGVVSTIHGALSEVNHPPTPSLGRRGRGEAPPGDLRPDPAMVRRS